MSKGKYRVILMRGISGSGKSTYIEKNFPDAVVCSADHFFINEDGVYEFDKRKLGQAHEECRRKFKQALEERHKLIVVDNTNTMMKEMQPYVKAAKYRGYRVECIRLDTPLEVAAARNTHNVPFGAIRAMHERMCDVPSEWNEVVVRG